MKPWEDLTVNRFNEIYVWPEGMKHDKKGRV